jgi:CMP/dCMP kinase
MIITIDGPAGAGKSSVARAVAERLGFDYLDTGALYRAVALAVIEAGLADGDADAIGDLVAGLNIEARGDRILLGGRDVSSRIRDGDVTEAVARISTIPAVRTALVGIQRAAAQNGNVVMEGRDLGTVVVPDADLKVYLTASLEERAERRARQEGVALDGAGLARIRDSIRQRDELDSTRGQSPLTQAEDAVRVDSTELSQEEVVNHIAAIAGSRNG